MKTLTAFLLINLLIWQPLMLRSQGLLLLAGSVPVESDPATVTTDDFDGADTGWTESGTGGKDYDYATPFTGSGSEALRITATAEASRARRNFTTATTVYCRFKLYVTSCTRYLASMQTSGVSDRAWIRVTSNKLNVGCTGGSDNATTTDLPLNTPLWIWFEYEAGATSYARAGWSTTATKPTLSAGGATTCATTGTSTESLPNFSFGDSNAYTADMVFDDLKVSTVGVFPSASANP